MCDVELRVAHERIRIAEALDGLPALTEAMATQRLTYSTIRELTRIAVPETEAAWIEAAAGKTAREIETLVAGRERGDRPDTVGRRALKPKILRFEVTPDTRELMRDAKKAIEARLGERVSDDELIRELCAGVLNPGEGEATRPPYQIAYTVCRDCDRGQKDGVDVSPETIEQARCDCDDIGSLDADAPARLTTSIPPATRRLVLARDQHRCVVPGCRSTRYLEIHHLRYREHGGDHDPRNLVTLCGAHHGAHHDGRLRIERRDGALHFAHADGRRYGSADHSAVAFTALRSNGFDTTTARAAVAKATAHVGTDAPLAELLRAALQACGELRRTG